MLAVLFITTEYRRGLIRTSLTASPRRGRVLAAKAVVIAAITFVAGLVGAAAAVPLGEHLLTANGNFIAPVTTLTWLRVVAGTVVTDPTWQRHLQQIAPSTAGLAIQATTGLHDLPINPWAGLGVLGLWATGALLAGAGRLALRDA